MSTISTDLHDIHHDPKRVRRVPAHTRAKRADHLPRSDLMTESTPISPGPLSSDGPDVDVPPQGVTLSRLKGGERTWRIDVRDDGTGMDAVVLRIAALDARLAELFTGTPPKASGTPRLGSLE